MHAVTRAALFVPLTISLSACAWMPSFLRNDPPQLQAAQLQEEPVPRIIPAAFVQSLPVSRVVAVPTLPAGGATESQVEDAGAARRRSKYVRFAGAHNRRLYQCQSSLQLL